MKQRLLIAATTMIAVATLGTGIASAAPVDKNTFETQAKAALTTAMTSMEGMAEETTLNIATAEGVPVGSMYIFENPDGSNISKVDVFGIKSESRCVKKTVCYTKTGSSRFWKKSKGTNGQVTSSFNPDKPLSIGGPDTTYDIAGNVYTVTDPEQGTQVLTIDGTHITVTGTSKDKASGVTLSVTADLNAVTPAKVTAPPKRLIKK